MLGDPISLPVNQTREIIHVGSRKSQLALTQTRQVISQLSNLCPDYEYNIHVLDTRGDRMLEDSPLELGEKGLFTQELEEKLLDRTLDFVVHSLKDLPTSLPNNLTLGAITKREKPADVLVLHPAYSMFQIDTLPLGSVVGTSSLRRLAQLKYQFPELETKPLRGNVNTRLAKLNEGQYDAIVLAAAGLIRLDMTSHIHQFIPPEIMMHAVGQGALGIECHKDNGAVLSLLEGIEDYHTCQSCLAERALLRTLESGCQAPIGVAVDVDESIMALKAIVVDRNGNHAIKQKLSGSIAAPELLGEQLAESLIKAGAKTLLGKY